MDGTLSPLQEIREAYFSTLQVPEDDKLLIDALISGYISNLHPRMMEPVWVLVIGPPGAMKTESLRPFYQATDAVFISSLTENALISGYTDDNGADPSLVLQLDGKVLILKDLTSLLNDTPTKITKIWGDLRDLFDGFCAKPSGRAGLRSYTAKFGIIAAVTPFIDAYSEHNQQFGERFISIRVARYRNTPSQSIETLLRIEKTVHTKHIWRIQLKEAVQKQITITKAYIAHLNTFPSLTDPQKKSVGVLAYILSQFRTMPIKGSPVDAEAGNRVFQQLLHLGHAHAISDQRTSWNDSDIILLKRIVIDTLTINRRRLLTCLFGTTSTPPVGFTSRQLSRLIRSSDQGILSIVNQYLYSGLIVELSTKKGQVLYRLADDIRALLTEVSLLSPGPHLPQLTTNPHT